MPSAPSQQPTSDPLAPPSTHLFRTQPQPPSRNSSLPRNLLQTTQARPERSTGSATQTETPTPVDSESDSTPLILRLRGAHNPARSITARRRQIQWAEDVVDNEGLGRKKSKVCCIYHKNRAVGESSSEDDSSDCCSSSSDSSGEDSDGGAPVKKSPGAKKGRGRRRSPNAYEKMPKHAHTHKRGGDHDGHGASGGAKT